MEVGKMGKEEIKIIEDSKHSLESEHENFAKSVKDDLSSFKKKALEKV